jgi:hypothetical protein
MGIGPARLAIPQIRLLITFLALAAVLGCTVHLPPHAAASQPGHATPDAEHTTTSQAETDALLGMRVHQQDHHHEQSLQCTSRTTTERRTTANADRASQPAPTDTSPNAIHHGPAAAERFEGRVRDDTGKGRLLLTCVARN